MVMQRQPGPRPGSAAYRAWEARLRQEEQWRRPVPIYVKVITPSSLKIVFYSAGGTPHQYPAPLTVGLRARHRYAFAIQGLADRDNPNRYGSIEVIRGPYLPPDVKAADAPVPLRFDEQDIIALTQERMLLKVISLETPEKALPSRGDKNETIRYEAEPNNDPIAMAKELGDLVMVVRIGTRVPTPEELSGTIPGSLLVPRLPPPGGDPQEVKPISFVYADSGTFLPTGHRERATSPPPMVGMPKTGAPCPPIAQSKDRSACRAPEGRIASGPGAADLGGPLALTAIPDDGAHLYDEYLCDGGDLRPKAGIDPYGELVNVDPMDTVAEYRTRVGGRRVVESNRVCVFAPRYIEVIRRTAVEGYEARQLAGLVERDRMDEQMVGVTADAERTRYDRPAGARMRMRPSGLSSEQWSGNFLEILALAGTERRIGWAQTTGLDKLRGLSNSERALLLRRVDIAQRLTQVQFPQVVGMVSGVGEVRAYWNPVEVVAVETPPKRPGRLLLEKLASTDKADIGDTVEFEIRYTNIGEETIDSVAIVDSLLARLEYVPQSASSSRDAVFTAQENEVGSQVLRWEIKETLKGKESGEVRFKVRVR